MKKKTSQNVTFKYCFSKVIVTFGTLALGTWDWLESGLFVIKDNINYTIVRLTSRGRLELRLWTFENFLLEKKSEIDWLWVFCGGGWLDLSEQEIPTRGNDIFIYIFISSLWQQSKVWRKVPALNTQYLKNLAKCCELKCLNTRFSWD